MSRCSVIIGKLAPHPCGAHAEFACTDCHQSVCQAHRTATVCDHCRGTRERPVNALSWDEMWAFDDDAHLFDREVTLVLTRGSFDS